MNLMNTLRKTHLYLGCFFAPLLIFFICTGWYQTVNPDRRKGATDSDTWISHLTRVHVEQYYPTTAAQSFSTKLFTVLVVLMSVALLVSTALGIILAFRFNRQKWSVWAALILGIAVPVLFLWLGQKR